MLSSVDGCCKPTPSKLVSSDCSKASKRSLFWWKGLPYATTRKGRWAAGWRSLTSPPACRTKRQARETAECYRVLVDGADIGIALIDAAYNIVMINPKQAGYRHKNPCELLGKKCFRELEGREAVCPHCPGLKAMASGSPAEVEVPVQRDDGSTYVVQIKASPISDRSGKATGFIELVEDISERKQSEEKLQWLASLPSENPSPVLRIGREGTILYSNNAGSQLLETWGCREGERLPGPWRQRVLDALRSGNTHRTECTCGQRVMALTLSPILGAGYVNLYAMDVSDRKRAEDALRRE